MAKAKINPEFTYKTRDGREVTDVQFNETDTGDRYVVEAYIEGYQEFFTDRGYYYNDGSKNDKDLIKQPAKKTKPSREVEVSPLNSQAVPHKHHDLIVEWAKNPKLKMQFRQNSDGGSWYDNDSKDPHWYEQNEYRIKPEEPKFLTIIGADGKARSYPEPCKVKLDMHQGYFLTFTNGVNTGYFDKVSWVNGSCDNAWLKKGLVHLTKEAAELHAKAMLGID